MLLAIFVLGELPKVAIVDPVGNRNHLFVKALRLPRLVAPDQEDRRPLGIKGEEDPHRLGYPQLLHVGMPGALHGVGERPACARTKLLQGLHRGDDLALLLVCQAFPPLVELAGPLGSPTHDGIITLAL